MEKKCKGIRGLKQHYSYAHKEFIFEISQLYETSFVDQENNVRGTNDIDQPDSERSVSLNDLGEFLNANAELIY